MTAYSAADQVITVLLVEADQDEADRLRGMLADAAERAPLKRNAAPTRCSRWKHWRLR